MTAKMPWLILLTLAWRFVDRVSADIAARQKEILVFPEEDLNSEWTSCAPATFNWRYVGPDVPFSFFLDRIDVANDTATSTRPLPTFTDNLNSNVRSLHRRDESFFRIASSISPFDRQLNVSALSVPPGRYKLVAMMISNPPHSSNSSVFTVNEGSSTSCLLSSPIFSSTSSTFALSSTATSSGFASVTSSDVSATSPTVVPVGGVSSTPVNKGAIAGGVIAGIAVLTAIAVFYFFVIHRGRSRAHSRAPGGPHSHGPIKGRFNTGASGGRDGGGRWGGLASIDSHIPPNESKVRPYGNTGRQSIGAGVSQDDINSDLSRSGSAHYGSYLGSPSEEKFSSSPSDEMMLSAVPYRGHDLKLHIPNNNLRPSAPPPPSPFEHRYSQTQARRSSLDSSSLHGQSHAANPPAPSPASLARKPSPVTPATPRKPARKPVPAYDETPAVPVTSPAPSSPPVPAPAPAATPFADPVLPHAVPASSGHYSTRAERESLKSLSSKPKSKLRKDRSNSSSANASREEIPAPVPVPAPQNLAHKNSFGPGGLEGKQLHYLIPDMPVAHR